ncbi:cytokine-dependent hematopoietic cell linker [Archocentrus centrarchus]|uniref:cytokine-dependent hematopoietic cell linker n=1 Tax=Archocentrus centrarchus TaxID=63155 RepID=UPI0011E9FD9B|nr:cytokine-dependent hematopoietic cell linker [Archocentrus centrarchus]
MDRSRADRNKTQKCINDTEEPKYDVVDNQEQVLSVRILPARPINDDREYADRDLPRSSSAQNISPFAPSNSNILPRCSPRETPFTTGPVVNRDLKPGRQKIKSDRKIPPVAQGDQHSHRSLPTPSPFTLELVSVLSGMAEQEPFKRERERETARNFSSHMKGPLSSESLLGPQSNYRHSLDLESHMERRSQQSLERVPSKRHHHEWPQTKEDFDQHDFVPMEKPQETCEEDWYIGSCNRADAEHALHLVNKDGAFLVRDCSTNNSTEPLVLVVYHEKKVYNVKIRFIETTKKYALGTGYRSNDMFDSVADIIKFHSIFPITLISGRNMTGNKYPDNCVLTFPITKWDVERLLQ